MDLEMIFCNKLVEFIKNDVKMVNFSLNQPLLVRVCSHIMSTKKMGRGGGGAAGRPPHY